VRRRGRRVVTPDGYVWFVRRRRARRRPFWSPRDRYPERFHGEEELPDPDEKIPLPGPLDLFNTRGEDIGQPGFDRYLESDRVKGGHAIVAILVATVVVGMAVWLVATYVLPWLVPLVVDHARPLLAGAAVLAVLAALNQVHRPWYVELRRQGLADAPRRVWRVQGWRRSGRLMGELTAAIREGRIDRRRAVILRTDPGR
jgi:hypothetical protein